jgi:hypothetical protein
MGTASTAGCTRPHGGLSGAEPHRLRDPTEANNNRIVRVVDNGDETDAINGNNAINLASAV